MSAKLKKLPDLSKRGPYRVLEGDLGYTGLPGTVYAPAEGRDLPGVAFGHDWMKPVTAYTTTLRHLASWGIVVAAPSTETGFNADHAGFAADLETSLQILAGVKMGNGNITVSPGKLGVAGHGMGAGAAVLASVGNTKAKAVAAIYPAHTAPSSLDAARNVYLPGMVIGPDDDSNAIFDAGNPAKLAYNWAGDVVYRVPKKGNQRSFSEDGFAQRFIGLSNSNRKVQNSIRGLLVGYFLHKLAGERSYSGYGEADASGKGVESFSGEKLVKRAGLARDDSPLAL
ncbi:Alpha/beta hydrolase family protein [Corynebacterium capitovis DSM 44611]|uniref:poly(ethylene terephthalate) hydrolase family protein n=1 Tax=Corynebacterium capitovis TaxID=131081 RepID=UPI0003697E81|nr:dienelactone hydrolase family protein [Corynebacterium capitovis]WKD56914.1 Alpha/beta hydrolase family protein [Corynebacterium capitovis DSM 44611]